MGFDIWKLDIFFQNKFKKINYLRRNHFTGILHFLNKRLVLLANNEISVIALNLGMYVAAPAVVGFAASKRIRSNN